MANKKCIPKCKNLGKLIAVHGIAAVYLQRAVFIVILSFIFFLAMMFAFYIRQSMVYFLLASAFLILYLVTLFSWVIQRRNLVKIHQDGIAYKDRIAGWSDMESIADSGVISMRDAKPIVLPVALHDRDGVIELIRQKILRIQKTKMNGV